MRIHTAFVSILSLAALSAAAGQVIVSPRAATARAPMALRGMAMMDTPRAVIGVTTSTSTGVRDTLGLLVSTVTRNGPAEKAGIEEGNRIASINGVTLKLATADIGDPDMENLMSRRLIRELDKVKPGDDVDLRVYGGGQVRSLKVKTVDPESLYSARSVYRKPVDDRPTFGIGVASTGSKRDTLGVFVMSVDEGGPAAKAGIEEGQRIAAINGIDLRVSREDAGDDMVSSSRVNRFERELARMKVGDAADLKIFANGQTKNVRVTTVAWSGLDSHRHSVTIIRDGGGMTMVRPARPPGDIEIKGQLIGETVRAAVEKAQAATSTRLEDLGHLFDDMGRALNVPGSIRWFDDESPTANQVRITPPKPAPAGIRTMSRTISM